MRPIEVPERYTETIYVCVYCDPSNPLYGMVTVRTYNPEDDDNLLNVGQTDIDVPLSAGNTTEKQVAKLRKTKQQIIDEATDKASQIDEAIESLLAIEYKESE